MGYVVMFRDSRSHRIFQVERALRRSFIPTPHKSDPTRAGCAGRCPEKSELLIILSDGDTTASLGTCSGVSPLAWWDSFS